MATIGYAGALGGIAKDAIGGAGKAFVGGLKGAFLRETPGLTAGYAFAKELNKRANAPKMASGGTAPPVNQQTSNSPAMGGLAAGVSLVAGQRQSNVISLEEVRQLKQLNNSVIIQSKLISFQIADQKRKDQWAEETANEQAIRDDALLNAIKNIGGGFGGGGKGKGDGNEKASGGLGLLGEAAASAAGGVAGGFLKDGLKYVTAAIVSAISIGLAFFRNQIAALVLSAALRFGGGAALGGAAAAAGTGLAISASAIAAIVAGVAALLFPTNAGAAEGKNADTRTGRDAANDPAGAKRRRAAEDATTKRAATRDQAAKQGREKEWDERFGKTHDPATGLLKDPKATTIYTPPAKGSVTSNFGEKRKDATGKETTHQGVDIAMAVGTDVSPIASGKVTKVQTSGAAGTYVQVTHPDGKISEYMHLSQALAKVGDDVTLASIIGKSGGAKGDIGAGSSTGPHLHLQLKTGSGEPIDPTGLPGLAGLTKGEKVSPADNTPKSTPSAGVGGKQKGDLPPAMEIDNTVAKFHDKLGQAAGGGPGSTSNVGIVPSVLGGGGGGGDDNNPYSLSGAGGRSRGMGGGTGLKFKKEAILVEDPTVKKAIDNVAKGLGVDPKSGSPIASKVSGAGNALQTKVLKPLFQSNSDIIKKTNQTFLQQFKSTATSAFTQAITQGLFPKGFGVSATTAGVDNNYRGQQLQQIFGTDKVINDATTKLLGKQYGPMFAPLFNNLAQGYLEVGSRVAGKAIFQGIGGLGAEETQTLTGQVLGNYAAGNKKLAFEQLLYGASGGSKGGIALGPETLLAKYGFKTPQEGIAYFASGLADMATAPLANMMGGDTTNGVTFDNRTGKYYNRDGSLATPAEYAAASRQYGASLNQGPLFSTGLDNYGGARQAGYSPYGTTQMQGGVVVQGYGQQYGASPGQFRVVAPTVNSITGISTAPTTAQAFGLTPQAQAGLSKEQLDVQQAQLDLAKIDGVKRAEEAKAKLISDAETRAQAAELEKGSAEYNRMVAAAEGRGNALVTMEAAKYTVSGLGGGKEGGGSATPGTGTAKPGDPGYRPGQLFQNPTDGSKLSFGQEVGNFAFDMGKNMLGNQLTKDIKNPYAQMVANFAIQKGLNYGFEAIKNSDFISNLFGTGGPVQLGGPTDPGILSTAGSWVTDTAVPWISNLFGFADGGIVTKATPGVFGEKGAEAIIPLSNPTATKALSAAMGTAETNNQLATSNDSLASIDNSLLRLSGGGTGSGTSVSSYGGGSWDIGLGSPSGGSVSSGSGGGTVSQGVSRSKPSGPSTMDYVTAIGGSVLKSMAISQGIGMASTALFGATPMALAGNFVSGAQLGAAGFTPATFVGPLAPGAATGMEVGSVFAPAAAVETTAVAAEGTAIAATGLEAGLAAIPGWGWAALGVLAVVSIFGGGYGGGGGGSRPPPKEPKYHAAIYVLGNNNINAIATIYETQDYHAVPDTYKTVAYGLLRVAFNATKVSEQSTKMPASYDWLYIKVQFDKVALLWGKGAPSPESLIADTATEVKTWDALTPDTNLSAYAQDIINLIRDEFKKTAVTDNLAKLDKAAADISGYSLNTLSKDLIPDLKSAGVYKLDSSIQKGIYADNVDESNRIGELVNAAAKHGAYMSTAMAAEYDEEGNITKAATADGVPMVWSVKDGAFVENKYPGALILDGAGRPVYDIEGTSAGLTKADFGGTDIVGINRPANVLLPPPPVTTAGGTGTNNTVVEGAKIDNSSVTNFYNSLGTVTDIIRSTTNQVGVIG